MNENKDAPLVSVVIICYNHDMFIKECLYSVQRQTYNNIELYVIDNSNDNSSKNVIESNFNLDDFTYFKQENIGLPKTLNKYIPITKGKYCIFMSADDYMLPTRVEDQVIFMEANPQYAMGYAKTIYVNEKSEKFGYNDKCQKSGYLFNELIRFKIHPPAPSYIFRKSIFNEVGYYDENIKLIEDRYMNIKIAEKHQIGYLDKFVVYHRQHPNNLTRTASFEEQISDVFYILNLYRNLPNYKSILKDVYLSLFNIFSKRSVKIGTKFMILSYTKMFKSSFWKSTYHLVKKILI